MCINLKRPKRKFIDHHLLNWMSDVQGPGRALLSPPPREKYCGDDNLNLVTQSRVLQSPRASCLNLKCIAYVMY